MAFCWFADFIHAPAPPGDAFLAATPGATRVLAHTPSAAHDPFVDDGAPPPLALQVYFAEAGAMEAALHGHLAALAGHMPGAAATQQCMAVRHVRVPDPAFTTPQGAPHCTYLVSYTGEADDPAAWLGHYLAHHTPIMARFPGVRQVEVAGRMDWVGGVAWPRAECLQRNKVVFDDPGALATALASPVRHEMRVDYAAFPPFRGGNTHFPMLTRVLA